MGMWKKATFSRQLNPCQQKMSVENGTTLPHVSCFSKRGIPRPSSQPNSCVFPSLGFLRASVPPVSRSFANCPHPTFQKHQKRPIMFSGVRSLFVRTALVAAAVLLSGRSSLSAQTLAQRLILKDGSYQSVTKYEINGDRVRYFSAERGEWEEVPTSLIDW